jgi:hypothetical protein
VDELSDHFDRHRADMGVGIALKQFHRLRKHVSFLGSAGPLLTPLARQRMQGGASDAPIAIVQHIHQIGESVGRQVSVEKLTTMQPDIRVVMLQPRSHCRKCLYPESKQRPIGVGCFVRECKFFDNSLVVRQHCSRP